jgi:trimethylamine:corrinoid methyltransferase-like protein
VEAHTTPGDPIRATLQVLSADDRAEMHERSLRVLSEVGMRVDSGAGR